MSWMEKAVNGVGFAERLVQRSVSARRWRGFKIEHAMEDAALALGTTPRRVRSLIRGEVFKVSLDECHRLLHRWQADIDQQTAELSALATKLEKEAEREWLLENQLPLPLDEPSTSSRNSSASGSGDQRS